MTAPAFTPGPWYSNGHSVYEESERIRSPEDRQGGLVNIPLMTAVVGRGEAIQNATLAAAAPDLYEAALWAKEALKPHLEEPLRTAFWKLVGALAKARGEQS